MWLAARGLGALSLLAVGAVHLQQYEDLDSAIPTIGTLFVVNFIAATVIGVGLLLPIELVWRRGGAWVAAGLALGGIALAAGSYVFLLVAERRPLFEIATVALLGLYLVVRHVPIGNRGRRSAMHPVSTREVRT